MTIPCKDCLCLGICRNKTYAVMVDECPLIGKLLYRRSMRANPAYRTPMFEKIIFQVQDILKSNTWQVIKTPGGLGSVDILGKHDETSL